MLGPPPEVARINTGPMFRVLEGEDEDIEAARRVLRPSAHSELAGLYAEAIADPTS